MLKIASIFFFLFQSIGFSQTLTSNQKVSFLALGDSYTIGQNVAVSERWPVQLIKELRLKGLECSEPEIIATTGWRTDDLKRAISSAKLNSPYTIVSLLIGVNNLYQGRSTSEYEIEFTELVNTAIQLAGGDKTRVLVLSIPDYGYTPFGAGNQPAISQKIDAFNNVNQAVANTAGVFYYNITNISRRGLIEPSLVANDGLHPSGKMYAEWVDVVLKGIMIKAAKEFLAGVTYDNEEGYIRYVGGNLPILISVPHGGDLEPSTIATRSCKECVNVKDDFTKELGQELSEEITNLSGKHAHVVFNLLHRKKLDANRDETEGADGNPLAIKSWRDFHAYIDQAKQTITNRFSKGLYIDLHGHGHSIQRIELGYLLYEDELMLANEVLNSEKYRRLSSLRNLALSNTKSLTHAELLKGSFSLGTLLENSGYPSVPSTNIPFPLTNEPYFSGGYNLVRHSSYQGGVIDGVQIECNQSIRFDPSVRKKFAKELAQAILDYVCSLYINDSYCRAPIVGIEPIQKEIASIYPKPACGSLAIEANKRVSAVKVYNHLGQYISELRVNEDETIDISQLNNGLYFLFFSAESKRHQPMKLLVSCN